MAVVKTDRPRSGPGRGMCSASGAATTGHRRETFGAARQPPSLKPNSPPSSRPAPNPARRSTKRTLTGSAPSAKSSRSRGSWASTRIGKRGASSERSSEASASRSTFGRLKKETRPTSSSTSQASPSQSRGRLDRCLAAGRRLRAGAPSRVNPRPFRLPPPLIPVEGRSISPRRRVHDGHPLACRRRGGIGSCGSARSTAARSSASTCFARRCAPAAPRRQSFSTRRLPHHRARRRGSQFQREEMEA